MHCVNQPYQKNALRGRCMCSSHEENHQIEMVSSVDNATPTYVWLYIEGRGVLTLNSTTYYGPTATLFGFLSQKMSTRALPFIVCCGIVITT